jgi:hypothetical protein
MPKRSAPPSPPASPPSLPALLESSLLSLLQAQSAEHDKADVLRAAREVATRM